MKASQYFYILAAATQLATCQVAPAATGDIQSVTVRAEGWTADVAISGLNIGGTYEFGLGAFNADFANARVKLTVTSHSSTNDGLPTTRVRTVYGTFPQRKPWPNVTTMEETNVSGVTTVRIILNEMIYQEDNTGAGNSGTAITATFLSGFYTSGGTPTNAVSTPMTVVNNSTVAFPEVISNWSWVPYQRMDSTSKLRCVAFHKFGEQYRPVRAVKFIVSDGTTTNSEFVTNFTLTTITGEPLPIMEYASTIDLTAGLIQGAPLTCDYIAYPWIGDNPYSTAASGAPAGSPLACTQYNVCDRTGGYGSSYAVVDSVNGSDPVSETDNTGKWCGTGTDPGTGIGLTAFLTPARAFRALRKLNADNHLRDDCGGGIVYAKPGSYTWLNKTISSGYGNVPLAWTTFKCFPGQNKDSVIITGSANNTDVSDRVKLEEVTINTSTGNTFTGCLFMWLDNVRLSSTSTGTWNSAGQRVWLTRSIVDVFTQGLRSFSITDMTFNLVRGNQLFGFNSTVLALTCLGNDTDRYASSLTIRDTLAGQVIQVPSIIAYNRFMGLNGASTQRFFIGYDRTTLTGVAVVQNVVEQAGTGLAGVASISSADPYEHNNTIFWHNTLVGARTFVAYNDDGDTIAYRKDWSFHNNYFDRTGNKGDNFGTPSSVRIGGWQIKFGVGMSGNYFSHNSNSLPGNFYFEYPGVSTWQPPTTEYGLYTDALFVDYKAAYGIWPDPLAANTGNGNYDIQANSPLIGLPIKQLVPYDMSGIARTEDTKASGAYAGPTPPTTPRNLGIGDLQIGTLGVQ